MMWLLLAGQLLLSHVSTSDRDPLMAGGISCRLARTDIPDVAPSARCAAESAAGLATRNRLRVLIGNAKEVSVRPDLDNGSQVSVDADGWPRDAQNRRLAFVSLDGLDLGLRLVRDGVAVSEVPGRSHDWCDPSSTAQKPALSGLH